VEEKKKTEKERREEGEKRVAGTTCTVPLGQIIYRWLQNFLTVLFCKPTG
jgi:hypothetical protein